MVCLDRPWRVKKSRLVKEILIKQFTNVFLMFFLDSKRLIQPYCLQASLIWCSSPLKMRVHQALASPLILPTYLIFCFWRARSYSIERHSSLDSTAAQAGHLKPSSIIPYQGKQNRILLLKNWAGREKDKIGEQGVSYRKVRENEEKLRKRRKRREK